MLKQEMRVDTWVVVKVWKAESNKKIEKKKQGRKVSLCIEENTPLYTIIILIINESLRATLDTKCTVVFNVGIRQQIRYTWVCYLF